SRRRHTRFSRDWSSDVCSSDLINFEGFSFTEAPWVHKYQGKYYLTYATEFPEKIAYAMADNIEGPYEYKGILNEIAGNSNTNHRSEERRVGKECRYQWIHDNRK